LPCHIRDDTPPENPAHAAGGLLGDSGWYRQVLGGHDMGLVWAFDQIDARVVAHTGNRLTVRLTNRPAFPARWNCRRVDVPAGSARYLELAKTLCSSQ
jgi:hypothetical protein